MKTRLTQRAINPDTGVFAHAITTALFCRVLASSANDRTEEQQKETGPNDNYGKKKKKTSLSNNAPIQGHVNAKPTKPTHSGGAPRTREGKGREPSINLRTSQLSTTNTLSLFTYPHTGLGEKPRKPALRSPQAEACAGALFWLDNF